MIDFGLIKRYKDPKTGEHIPFKEGKSLTGTARYASLHTHNGLEQSRRDDLECLGFVILYFLKGKLPWQGLPAKTKEEKYELIKKKKAETTVEQLCKGLDKEILKYFTYVRSLAFEDRPDIPALRRLFLKILKKHHYEYDFMFDWIIKKSELKKGNYEEKLHAEYYKKKLKEKLGLEDSDSSDSD